MDAEARSEDAKRDDTQQLTYIQVGVNKNGVPVPGFRSSGARESRSTCTHGQMRVV